MGKLYFAYGANMHRGHMMGRCPTATRVGMATLGGYRFVINSLGVATVVAAPGCRVFGALWLIGRDTEDMLDYYEGVDRGLYYKRSIGVLPTGDDHTVTTLVYLAYDATPGYPRTDYLRSIVTAAKRNGLSDSYVDELQSWFTFQSSRRKSPVYLSLT